MQFTLTFSVSEEHIREGFPENVERCAIALALDDAGAERPTVDSNDIYLELPQVEHGVMTGHNYWHARTPQGIRDFIKAFDDPRVRQYCRPARFTLHLESF